MKKLYILGAMLLLLFASHSSRAQSFKGGITAGIAPSQVAGDKLSGYNKLGFKVGIWTSYDLTKKSSLQLELDYITKGSQANPDKDQTYNYKLHLSYIQMPLSYHYELLPKFYLEGGLALGVIVSHYEEENRMEYVSNNFNQFTASFIGGCSYQFSERFKLALVTNNDLTPLRNDGPRGIGVTRFGGDYGQFNDLLILSLYYKLK